MAHRQQGQDNSQHGQHSNLAVSVKSSQNVSGINARHELLGAPTGVTAGASRSQLGLNNPGYQSSPSRNAPGGGANPPSELEQIHLQINNTTDQSLESTRRMLGMMEESQETGAKTIENLYRQGEQLDKVEENLDTMGQDMREAEKNMEQMDKCCGLCVCPWRKRRNFETTSGYQKSFGNKATRNVREEDREAITMEQPNVESGQYGAQRGFITKVTNDAREDEMDENLGQVSSMLGGLKNMATDMGQEIHKQNRQLDRVIQKAEVTDNRVVLANKHASELLKKA